MKYAKHGCEDTKPTPIVAISLPHWSIIGANAFQWLERENKNLVETQAQSGYTGLKHP